MTVRRRFRLGTNRRFEAILLGSNSGMAFAAARCLRLAGVDFHLVATGRYWSARTMRGCLGSTVITPEQLAGDGRDVLALLRMLLARNPDSVVVPSGIDATLFLARIKSELPIGSVFPLSPEPLLLELNDKWRFAAMLDRLGLPHPRTSLLSTVDEIGAASFAEPVVVKPLSAEGAQGVHVVRSANDLRLVVRRVAAAGLLPVLMQEFIPGDDLGVSVVADHGEVRAHRVQQFLPDGSLRFIDRPDALTLATTIVSATAAHGVFNIDLRRDERDDRLVVIECNPRLYATSHKSAYSGMNPVGLGIDLARGVTLDGAQPPPPKPRSVDVMSPLKAGAEMVRGRGSELSGPTRIALHAEVANPVSSVVRAAEWRFPGIARRLRGERAVRWEAYEEREGA